MRLSSFFKVAVLVTVAFVGSVTVKAQNGVVSLEHISNTLSPYALNAGSSHVVSVRYNLLGNDSQGAWTPYWWGSNGFEIYSPDGADWVSFTGTRGPLVNNLRVSTVRFDKHFNFDGTTWTATGNGGDDPAGGSTGASSRAGFHLATVDAQGLGGYQGGIDNDIALTFQFHSLIADEGKTICFDTCAAITAWEWSNGDEDFPIWDNGLGVDGPRCWLIARTIPQGVIWVTPNPANVTFPYCEGGSYQLHAVSYSGMPVAYSFAPGYETGLGSLNPSTGLWTWSGPTVPPGGSAEVQFLAWDEMGAPTVIPFTLYVTITTAECDCCIGRVGDVNGSNEDEPTVGDISAMIDHLFISGGQLICIEEADVNQSGGATPTADDITIGDVSALIDYLFITGPETGILPDCM